MKKIIAIISANLIPICIVIILALLLLNSLDVIDLDDLSPIMTLQADDSVHVNSPSIEAMLKSCQDIAQFYATAEPRYTYNSKTPPWDTHYKDGKYHTSCCSIYVLQVFVDIGLTDTLGGQDVWYVWDWMKANPQMWEYKGALEEKEMKPGDVQIYKGPDGSRVSSRWEKSFSRKYFCEL